jgi:hypothetical protein
MVSYVKKRSPKEPKCRRKPDQNSSVEKNKTLSLSQEEENPPSFLIYSIRAVLKRLKIIPGDC